MTSRTKSGAGIVLGVMGLAAVLAAGGSAWEEYPLRPVSGFEGLWAKCYEPGLPDVTEPEYGYLALMPDGRYYELLDDCCPDTREPAPPFWNLGKWGETADGEGVRTSYRQKLDDEVVSGTFRLLRARRVVLWTGDERTADVLTPSGGINYSWCRIYPDWPVGPTPTIGDPPVVP